MKDVLDAIIFYEELSREQQRALRDTITSEPKLLEIFNRWQHLKGEIRNSLDESLPDRDQLVLYALRQNKETYLTPEEETVLNRSLPGINKALNDHPGLELIVDDIRKAQADFLQCWRESAETGQLQTNSAKIYPLGSQQFFSPRITRIAAAFLLLCLSLFAAQAVWQTQRIETVRSSDNTFRTVHFKDGSMVRLVGASEITYARPGLLSSFDRQVKLSGQAFFDITPSKKPFTVESAIALTQATGTQFSIDAQPNQTEVILTNGQVTLQSKEIEGRTVTLSPGERSFVLAGHSPSTPETLTNITEQLSWTGLFVFHASPLSYVAEHFESHFNVNIDVAKPLESEQFKATFDPDTLTLDEALGTLSLAFDARIDTIQAETDSYLLTPFEAE